MLKITILLSRVFNEETNKVERSEVELELEHSLVSLSKWESKYEKPFLGKDEKTSEEILDYIRCMILTPDYPPDVLKHLSQENADAISAYIDAKMTATWFPPTPPGPPNRETITSELVYYWMSSYQIPWDAENWHLNRLFTLIRIFGIKQGKQTKRSRSDLMAERHRLNEQRRKQMGSSG